MSVLRFAAPLARPVEVLIGLVFLLGAVAKALDINLFIVQITFYGVLDRDSFAVPLAALGTVTLEAALGMGLLAGIRRHRAMHTGVVVLLLVFCGLVVYGWVYHDLEDCGCFGRIEMGPGPTLAKNAVLILAAVVAAIGWEHKGPRPPESESRRTAKTLAISLAAVATLGYSAMTVEQVVEGPRPFAQFTFAEQGLQHDLGEGTYFVAMLNATCDHCAAAVADLNELVLEGDAPPVVALCEGVALELEEFRMITAPLFPLHTIGIRTFYNFIGDAPPRFYLIEDGAVLEYWDDEVPGADAIARAREGA